MLNSSVLGNFTKAQKEKLSKQQKTFVLTSYKVSKENNDLRIFAAAECVEGSSIDDVTKEQINKPVDDRCKLELDEDQLHLIDLTVENLSIKTRNFEAENII